MAERFPEVGAQREFISLGNFYFSTQKAALFSSSICKMKPNFTYASFEFLVQLTVIQQT